MLSDSCMCRHPIAPLLQLFTCPMQRALVAHQTQHGGGARSRAVSGGSAVDMLYGPKSGAGEAGRRGWLSAIADSTRQSVFQPLRTSASSSQCDAARVSGKLAELSDERRQSLVAEAAAAKLSGIALGCSGHAAHDRAASGGARQSPPRRSVQLLDSDGGG